MIQISQRHLHTIILGCLLVTSFETSSNAQPARKLEEAYATIISPSGTFRVPESYLGTGPKSPELSRVLHTESWGFLFWHSDGFPLKQSSASVTGLQPKEEGRAQGDFLVEVTAVRSLIDPASGRKPVGVQLANFLAGGTADLEFSASEGCLALTQTTGTTPRMFFYGDTGYKKFPNNVRYLFRSNVQGSNNYIDGQIDYPERGLEVHVVTARTSLKDMPDISERIFGFLDLWRISDGKQN